MINRKRKSNPLSKLTPPSYITIDAPGDVDIGQMYWPVDTDDLMGQGITGEVHRQYSIAEILASLPPEFRSDVTKWLKKGYSPVLFVDLLSGATALEMRIHVPPAPSFLEGMRLARAAMRDTAPNCPQDARKLRERGRGTSRRAKAPLQSIAMAKRPAPHRGETQTYAVTKP